jgi:site-specific DNA-methyltransferase (adenine-specific)
MDIDEIYCSDNVALMAQMPDEYIDLVVTSPPYDNLRDYHGYTLDVPAMVDQFMRIVKPGGVIVWIVGDATINGSETGTSFRQALMFMDGGFRLHDTMIYEKNGCAYPNPLRYHNCFEYTFIFSKEKPRTVNLIKDRKNRWPIGSWGNRSSRHQDGILKPRKSARDLESTEYGVRFNIWRYNTGAGFQHEDEEAHQHPATFPEKLARDHIISWSNEGDLVFDPMCGSGTTCKMAERLDRHWIGCDVSEEYCEIARERIRTEQSQLKLSL